MTITWAEIVKGLAGLAGLVIVGWAGWLSLTMVDVKTQVSGIDSKLSGVGDRVTRISERLPTEIALHTRELYEREIRTAVISGKAQFRDGIWTRYVAVFDQENDRVTTFPFPISSPTDDNWLRGLLWTVSSRDQSSVRVSVLEQYRQLYDVDVPAVPTFIDTDNSIITSKRFEDVMQRVDAQYQQRSSTRPDAMKPVVKRLFQDTSTFQELVRQLSYHEAEFKP